MYMAMAHDEEVSTRTSTNEGDDTSAAILAFEGGGHQPPLKLKHRQPLDFSTDESTEIAAEKLRVRSGVAYRMHSNVRVFSRALLALARVSDELIFEPTSKGLSVRSRSSTQQSFGRVFFANAFFPTFDVSRLKKGLMSSGNAPIRLSAKTAHSALKSAAAGSGAVANAAADIVAVDLHVDPEADKLGLTMRYSHKITKRYDLPLLDSVVVTTMAAEPKLDTAQLHSKISAPAFVLHAALRQIHTLADELSIFVDPAGEIFYFRNYIQKDDDWQNYTQTQARVPREKCTTFEALRPVEITFGMPEFTAFIAFAEQVSADVSMHFGDCGRPLVIRLDCETSCSFAGELTLATSTSPVLAAASSQSFRQQSALHPLPRLSQIAGNAEEEEEEDEKEEKSDEFQQQPMANATTLRSENDEPTRVERARRRTTDAGRISALGGYQQESLERILENSPAPPVLESQSVEARSSGGGSGLLPEQRTEGDGAVSCPSSMQSIPTQMERYANCDGIDEVAKRALEGPIDRAKRRRLLRGRNARVWMDEENGDGGGGGGGGTSNSTASTQRHDSAFRGVAVLAHDSLPEIDYEHWFGKDLKDRNNDENQR